MAIYSLHIQSVSRGNGSSAVGAAAYRAGERLRDERTGTIHDHAFRNDVLLKEIVVPAQFANDSPAWAGDRGVLWNTAEAAETRQNGRVAREFLVALPWELSREQQVGLVRDFSRELSERYRFVVDATLHAPRDYPQSDPRNFHAHLLATTREAGVEGLGAKTSFEWSDRRRYQAGMKSGVHEVFHVRERWAAVTNAALEEARVNARIDHRTLAAQGIDREPALYIPYQAYAMERRGYQSQLADRLRAAHEARVQARLAHGPGHEHEEAGSLEDIRRRAREDWLKLRGQEAGRARDSDATLAAARDDDFTR